MAEVVWRGADDYVRLVTAGDRTFLDVGGREVTLTFPELAKLRSALGGVAGQRVREMSATEWRLYHPLDL